MIKIICADMIQADERTYRSLYERASAERKSRADRYRWQEDKLRCVAAEALLRMALGTDDYRIEKNSSGKPYVSDKKEFFYNISHSGRYVVLAWGNSEVGVDVQRQDTNTNVSAIANRFFTSDERELLQREPQRFFEIWTKKESYLKYIGKGLYQDLGSFSVLTPAPGIRYQYYTLEGGYSLSLCTTEDDLELKMLDVQQLLY